MQEEEDYDEDETMYTERLDTKPTKENNIFNQPLELINDIADMYNTPVQTNDKARCLIVPNKKWKLVWDMYVVFLLLTVSILVPYRLAFFPEDDFQMMMVYAVIDTCFFIDLILTFFTTTVDPKS